MNPDDYYDSKHYHYDNIRKAVKHADEELDTWEITEALVDGLGIKALYLAGPLKVILKKKYGKDN